MKNNKEIKDVVRCKDCCHGEIQQIDDDGRIWIDCGKAGHLIDGEWFCADGERGERV